MEMSTRKNTKIMAAFLAMILFISSCISQADLRVVQAAGKKSAVVATQAQLEKALKNADLTKIVIQTKKAGQFSIPKGGHKSVNLVVKAPDAEVTNSGEFKSITVASMKKGIYTEAANRNTIRLIASEAKLRVQAGYTVQKLTIVKKSTATVLLDGEIEALHVNARSTLKLKGSGGNATVYINKGGKNSTVETELPVTLRMAADASVVLNEGGGESRIIVGKNNVSYSITNNTKRALSLDTLAGKKTLSVGKTYNGKTSKNIPNSGIEVSGGGSSGGGGSSNPTVTDTGRGGYTRGEWVALLSKKLGFLLKGDVKEELYYFSDTQGKTYGEMAELAQAYGLLPESDADGYEDPGQDVPMFEADKKVTREYATYTVVKALGYVEEGVAALECGDKSGLSYGAVDAIGVEQGIIALKNDRFLPGEELDKATGNAMLAKMDEISAAASVGAGEAVEKIEYHEDGSVKSIEYAGVCVPDVRQIVPAKGVSRASDRAAYRTQSPLGLSADGSAGVSQTYELTADKTVGDVKVSGKVTLSIPDITCKVKAEQRSGRLEFDEFLLSVPNEVKVNADLTCSPDEYEMSGAASTQFKGGKAELARIPCPLGNDLSVDLIVSLEVQAKGNVKISYSVGAVQGIQLLGRHWRLLRDFDQSLEELGAKGSFQTGMSLDCRLKAREADVARVNLMSGFAGSVAYVTRPDTDPAQHCGEGRIYLYSRLEIPAGSPLGDDVKQWHIGGTWQIFAMRNSPFLESMHFENMQRVERCTYGKGSLEGTVVDVNRNRITGAKVELCRDGVVLKHAFSGMRGEFSLADMGVGFYTLKVKATGSSAYEVEIEIRPERKTYVEACIMLDRNTNVGDGSIRGEIIHAVTGDKVENVSYAVRKNWGSTTGEILYEGQVSEEYELNIPSGNYTIQFKAEGFVDCDVNVAVIAGVTVNKTVALAPTLDVNDDLIRIVLTWGEHPEDLDSHLIGYTPDRFHIFFADKIYRHEDGELVADLDLDDTDSYGPETVTFYRANNSGTYSYYVHDYTNKELTKSQQLSLSGAQVRVYQGRTLLECFNVPGNEEGTLWHVFDFDLGTKTLTPKNVMSYGENEDFIGDLLEGEDDPEVEQESK